MIKQIDYNNNIITNLSTGETQIIPFYPRPTHWESVESFIEAKPRKPLYKARRNEPCPCGSGKKFKKCCIDKFVDIN